MTIQITTSILKLTSISNFSSLFAGFSSCFFHAIFIGFQEYSKFVLSHHFKEYLLLSVVMLKQMADKIFIPRLLTWSHQDIFFHSLYTNADKIIFCSSSCSLYLMYISYKILKKFKGL